MSKVTEKIKEVMGAADNLTNFKKFSKLKASYVDSVIRIFMKAIFAIPVSFGLKQVVGNACL